MRETTGKFQVSKFPNPETQFKPGESGNMNGRPKGIERLIREFLEAKIKNKSGEEITRTEAILHAQFKKAMERGDTKASEFLYDRLFGKPRSTIDIGGQEDGSPIKTTLTIQFLKSDKKDEE